jgi:hypothetical protein
MGGISNAGGISIGGSGFFAPRTAFGVDAAVGLAAARSFGLADEEAFGLAAVAAFRDGRRALPDVFRVVTMSLARF